ncbi:MAG: hypothetical protein VW456_02140 [Alphaproteobacteria bacterium]
MQIWRPHRLAAGGPRRALCALFLPVMSLTGLLLIGQSFLAGPAFAKTVFLVCDGEFMTSSSMQGPTKTDQFDGALYLSVEANDFAVRRVKLLPFERSTRLAAIDLMPHPRSTDDGRVTVFTSTEDELVIEQTEARGKMVNALVGDDQLALTPESLHVMYLRLNRFSGYITISWQDHQVREVKPEGALRSIKKCYSNSKSFSADCNTMKQRIF